MKVKNAEDKAVSEYLARLGERVRAERAKRGMTRRILARDSGVSERYLAQLEGGTGNPSIALLRQVSLAMDVPLAALVAGDAEATEPVAALIPMLERASAEELDAIRRAALKIMRPLGEDMKNRRIALIGLRGGGKTTLGRQLAEDMGVPFVELNRVIEQEYGGSIGEILALNGQPAFRRYERRCLEAVIREHDGVVLSTAGGIVSEPSTFGYLLDHAHTVWVTASPEEHMSRVVAQGDLRPMAQNREAMEDLKAILAAREADYRRADATLETSGRSVEESRRDLAALVKSIIEAEEAVA